MSVMKSKAEIPTIDCELVTIEVTRSNTTYEFGFTTAKSIGVEPQLEETDAVKLMIKGKLKAQKPKSSVLTGNEITLKDNVFNPELVEVLQGGTVTYDQATGVVTGYTPPTAGSGTGGETFRLNAYSAQYNAAGQIVNYEKISYPNCTGSPVAFGAEDGTFRAPEYKIISAPSADEAPYTISYVDALPTLVDPSAVSSGSGSGSGT